MSKIERTSYDLKCLRPLKIMRMIFVVYVLVNLFLPLYSGYRLGVTKIYSFLSIASVGFCLLCAHGYFKQRVPLLPLTIIRLLQFFFTYIRDSEYKLNLLMFLIIIIFDIIITTDMMADRAKYEYIEIPEEEDDYDI